MTKRRAGIAVAAAALLLSTAAFVRGGWAVHTVENLPEYFVVGEPVEMSISVRQHGMALTPNMSMIEFHLTGPSSVARVVKVTPSSKPGYYTANLVVSEPGEWKIALRSGPIGLELLPLRAVAVGSAPPPRLTAIERGRQLYVAKGCVTCHGSGPSVAERAGAPTWTTRVNVGPELVGRSFPSREFVEQVMANPGQRAMPDLNLSREEIGAIASYLHPES